MSFSDQELQLVGAAFSGRSGVGWLRANCPLCLGRIGKEDRRLCLSFNVLSGFFRCYRCEARGYLPLEMRDQVVALPQQAAPVDRPPVERLEGFVPIFSGAGAGSVFLEPVRRYLLGRGLRADVLAEAGLGVAASGVGLVAGVLRVRSLAGYIVVPIPGPDASLGWFARNYTSKARMTHCNARGMERVLYNDRALAVRTEKPVYVVEGCLDALSLWPDAVATLGSVLDYHFELLLASERPVVFVPDGDAWRSGWANMMKLRFLGRRAGFVRLGPRVDPDEVSRAWLDGEAARSLEF